MDRRVLEVALFVGVLVVALLTDLVFEPDDFEAWALGTVVSQVAASTVLVTVTVVHHVRAKDGQKVDLPPLRLIFALPVAVALVLSPTIATGGGLDPDMAAVPSLLLFVLVGGVALLLGLIVAAMVVLPLMWVASTTWAVLRGRTSVGSALGLVAVPLILVGTVMSGVGGALGLRLPSGRSGRNVGPMLQGLLGIGDYSVQDEAWLLFGRIGLWMMIACVAVLVIGGLVQRGRGGSTPAPEPATDETRS